MAKCPHCGGDHSKTERNWSIWRARHTTDDILRVIGRAYSIDAERVRQIVLKRDKAVVKALTASVGTPTSDETREGILGVEFVFTHESLVWEEHGWRPLADSTGYDHRYMRQGYAPVSHAIDEGIVYRVKKVSEGD
jgi:hypothetical protein